MKIAEYLFWKVYNESLKKKTYPLYNLLLLVDDMLSVIYLFKTYLYFKLLFSQV